MFGKGILIARIFGISIEIDFSWFIIFFLVAWSLSTGYFPHFYPGTTGIYYGAMGIVAALLLFTSVLLHELSHSLVAIRNRLPISRITLFIFGGVANMEEEPASPGVEFRVAIAGPLCSFILAALFWVLSKVAPDGSGAYAVFHYVSFINAFLAFFNLIPGFPLDGGRLLRSALWHFTGNIRRSTLTASRIGKGFAVFLIFMGLFSIMGGNSFNGLWLIFIGFFLQKAAESSYRQLVIKEILTGLTVENVMNRQVISATGDLTLDMLVHDFFIAHHFNYFPVEKEGRLVGVVSMANVKGVDKVNWPIVRVEDVMMHEPSNLKVFPEIGVEEAFGQMLKEETGWLVVTDSKDRIQGVLTRGDIMHLMEIKSGLEED